MTQADHPGLSQAPTKSRVLSLKENYSGQQGNLEIRPGRTSPFTGWDFTEVLPTAHIARMPWVFWDLDSELQLEHGAKPSNMLFSIFPFPSNFSIGQGAYQGLPNLALAPGRQDPKTSLLFAMQSVLPFS